MPSFRHFQNFYVVNYIVTKSGDQRAEKEKTTDIKGSRDQIMRHDWSDVTAHET